MAVSISWGSVFATVLVTRALLFGVFVRTPDCWKLTYRSPSVRNPSVWVHIKAPLIFKIPYELQSMLWIVGP